MNAEALIGTVLGTSTLQQLIGQGGMGAVYLAQQTRPYRQVAVKVLMPATALKPHQLSAFLVRFRRENDATASLEHPNIMPVYEYGERGGLAYLVMPYISGGTLRDVMERDGQMSFIDALRYLEQMAAALDFAHARGVIHRDIKPANMLLTPDDHLLLTDFGLVKIISDQQSEQLRLTGAGAPVGTPDYMSPEQVIGGEVDGRADQYSLGVVLFHMLTGTTPFQGETPMQIASQQLHMQPPSPRLLRPDLPEAAEQVLLRAMSKRPEQRFNSAQEFASAFRAALVGQPYQRASQNAGGLLGGSGVRKGSLFDPKWQGSGPLPAFGTSQLSPVAQTEAMGRGRFSKTGHFPAAGPNGQTGAANPNAGFFATGQLPAANGMPQDPFGQSATMGFNSSFFAQPNNVPQQDFPTGNLQQMSPTTQSTTTALSLLRAEPTTGGNTIKLTGPVKVVQVPVAPGQYVTGLLPVQKELGDPISEPPVKHISKLQKTMLIVATLILLIGAVSGGFVLMRSHNTTQNNPANNPANTLSPIAQATATATANIIFSDPLNQNIHGWPTQPGQGVTYSFQNGAYQINNQNSGGAPLVVSQQSFNQPNLTYQITMQEVGGDDTNPANTFGLVLRHTLQQVNGKMIQTCYVFEIRNNNNNSEYDFFKYDEGQAKPWGNPLWKAKPGQEFHGGHGQNAVNTVKVVANKGSFTFFVNGTQVGTVQDNSLPSGAVGMAVNLKGTTVAFSNLLVTLK